MQSKRPRLWQNLDFSGATKSVSRIFIRHAVRYSENGVGSLVVHRFQHTDVIRNIATTCHSLHTLEILSLPVMLSETLIEAAQCASNLKKLLIHTDVSAHTVAQIVRCRPTLEHVEFTSIISSGQETCKGPFANLHTLKLKRNNYTNTAITTGVSFIESLVHQAPALQSLTVANWDAGAGLGGGLGGIGMVSLPIF
jgi:F-box/TPR repeat protein Pof3